MNNELSLIKKKIYSREKSLALDLNRNKSKTSKNKDYDSKVQKVLKKSKRRSSLRNSARSQSNRLNMSKNEKKVHKIGENLAYLKQKRKEIFDKNSSKYEKSHSHRSSHSKNQDNSRLNKTKDVKKIMIRNSVHHIPFRIKSRDSSQDTLVIKKCFNNDKEIQKLKEENTELKSQITELKSELKQVRKHLTNFLTTKNEEISEVKKKLEETIKDNTTMAHQQSSLLRKYLESQEEIRKMKKLMLHYPSQKSIIQQSSRESSIVAMSNFWLMR